MRSGIAQTCERDGKLIIRFYLDIIIFNFVEVESTFLVGSTKENTKIRMQKMLVFSLVLPTARFHELVTVLVSFRAMWTDPRLY